MKRYAHPQKGFYVLSVGHYICCCRRALSPPPDLFEIVLTGCTIGLSQRRKLIDGLLHPSFPAHSVSYSIDGNHCGTSIAVRGAAAGVLALVDRALIRSSFEILR